MKHPKPDQTQAANALLRARKLVLYLLIAIGTCTLITAILLVMHTVDMPPTVVVRSLNGSTSSNSSKGSAAAGKPKSQATDAGPPKPLSKELDPDFVDSKAQAVKSAKACPLGCEIRGNCNAEEGRCECPFGYYGPACDKEIFPACKLTAKSTEMHCGDRMPRSCECLRQCRNFFCPNKGRCETPRESWYVQCFERIAKNASDLTRAHGAKVGPGVTVKGPFLRGPVYSDVPEEWEEKQGLVEWFQGLRDDLPRKRLKYTNATYVQALNPGGTNFFALPLSQCPGGCLGRGQCIKTWTVGPKCLCWQGYTGSNCEQVHKPSCVNMCMNRGICRGGFCHCKPGWWGKDCSRSKAFAPHNAHSSVTALKIYAYELPTHLAYDMERFVGFQGHDPTYIAYKGFISGFMNDWTVRTENPWEANLFFVPALTYAYSSNLGDVTVHLQRVMTWVRDQRPFFNRTAGKDHFVWLPNDRGGCWIDPSDPLLGNLIKISHFGFHQTNTKLPEFKMMPQQGASCHIPERDVVAAPYSWQQELLANETYRTFNASSVPNGSLLFFAGSIRENEPEYSGGVRQVTTNC
eukprot:GHUV01017315.1.p1 GENE.GHUV01017315.1~~GHUV01017315.1.p1  ORF type:complete len:576 (+),score=57.68 GHUV01017315.1:463-2190(+)